MNVDISDLAQKHLADLPQADRDNLLFESGQIMTAWLGNGDVFKKIKQKYGDCGLNFCREVLERSISPEGLRQALEQLTDTKNRGVGLPQGFRASYRPEGDER